MKLKKEGYIQQVIYSSLEDLQMEPFQIVMALLTVFCITGVVFYQSKTTQYTNNISFKSWMRKFGKMYPKQQVFQKHFQTFIQNKKIVQIHNEQYINKQSKFEMQLNNYADKTNEQFINTYLTKIRNENLTGICQQLSDNLTNIFADIEPFIVNSTSVMQQTLRLPLFKDPTNKLFSTKQAILQMIYQQTEKKYNISNPNQYTENVFNFNTKLRNSIPQNCSFQQAYTMIIHSNEYQSQHIKVLNIKNKANQNSNIFSPKCYYKFLLNSTNQYIEKVLNYHPVLVNINANILQNYKGGIVDYNQWKRPQSQNNHSVMLIGTGVRQDGNMYWKLLNTWGRKWGQKGVFYLQRKQSEVTSDFQWMSFIKI